MIKIGIDPDVDGSGLAVLSTESSKNDIVMTNATFFNLFDFLKQLDKENTTVYIEAGWLNRSNWHKVVNGSAAINSQIGQRTGANHETGKKIVEMCEYLGLPYKLVKPTRKKVDAKLFQKLTGYIGRTNQEQRDAAMLII